MVSDPAAWERAKNHCQQEVEGMQRKRNSVEAKLWDAAGRYEYVGDSPTRG